MRRDGSESEDDTTHGSHACDAMRCGVLWPDVTPPLHVLQVEIFCIRHHRAGCDWKGEYTSAWEHVTRYCQYTRVPCRYCQLHMQVTYTHTIRLLLMSASVCPDAALLCDACGTLLSVYMSMCMCPIQRRLLSTHETSECAFRTMTCEHCTETHAYNQHTEHQLTCPAAPVTCDGATGCGETMVGDGMAAEGHGMSA